MSSVDFLFELGCEELPTQSVKALSSALSENIRDQLQKREITFENVNSFGTPRRLAVIVSQLSTEQAPRVTERQGPAYEKAYDRDGIPTLACLGFARSCGVSVDQLSTKDTEKGKRVVYNESQPGKPTRDIMTDVVKQAIDKLPIRKPMRWADHDFSFVRPIHWVVMLYGQEAIETELFGQAAHNKTRGHRFMHPEPITLANSTDYENALQSQGKVIADFAKRRKMIQEKIEHAAAPHGKAIIDEDLLDEVTALVEWPVILCGQFKAEFLQVPKEVLITSMQTHQKCFAIEGEQGKLIPRFIVVSNIESSDPATVIHGNERVINARLADAAFFYHNDRQHSLESRLPRLEHVVFQKQLGSLAEKSERIAELSKTIANQINIDTKSAEHAGLLCKCDLVTEMVDEFPKLQGIMGYYYALNDNDSEACALAIKEHYLPRFSGDKLPSDLLGCCIGIADRLDTLVGTLGINKIPTGDKDPFGLRRAALGLLRILLEKELDLDLMDLLEQAKQRYGNALTNHDVVTQAYDFCLDRLKHWYAEQGIDAEVFAAVAARRPASPLDFHRRLQAVQQFQTLPEANTLAAANKRVGNILKKIDLDELPSEADTQLFELDEERELAQRLTQQQQVVSELYQEANYTSALGELASLKSSIDAFFDKVLVMTDDEKIRNNRLALLRSLRQLLTQVADISLLPHSA